MDNRQYLEIFIKEAEDHLQSLDECVAALEQKPGSRSIISEICRTVHSLNGMAQTMGFWRMQHLAQDMEKLFESILDGGLKAGSRMIDFLPECLDALRRYLEHIKKTSKEGMEDPKGLQKVLLELLLAREETAHAAEHAAEALPAVLHINKKNQNRNQSQKQKIPDSGTAEKSEGHGGRTARMVSVDIKKLDDLMEKAGTLIMAKNRLADLAGTNEADIEGGIEELETAASDLHESIMRVRMTPVEHIVNKFPRMIRDLSRKLGRRIELYISGADTELDCAMSDQIGGPLKLLLCHMAKYGIEEPDVRWERGKHEKGAVYLNIYTQDGSVVFYIRDDGGEMGTEWQKKNLADIRLAIESLGGDMEASSIPKEEDECTIRIPLSHAAIQAVTAEIGGEKYAVALRSIVSVEDVWEDDVSGSGQEETICIRGRTMPLIRLERIFQAAPLDGLAHKKKTFQAILIKKGGRYAGLAVDRIAGRQEIVVKSLGRFIKADRAISGAAVLGNGETILVLDINALI